MALLFAGIVTLRLLAAGGWPMAAGLAVCILAQPAESASAVSCGFITWVSLAALRRLSRRRSTGF